MNTNLIYALTANGRSLAENAKEAGTVTLLGMVAIFAVLSLLWLVIEILHRALSKEQAPKNEPSSERQEEPTSPAPVQTVTAEPIPAVAAADGALIAAITAAVSAAMAEDGYTGGFRVVSFKRSSARRSGRS